MGLPDEEIERFQNHQMECLTRNGNLISGRIVGFELAANRPNMICGFTTQDGEKVGFGNIQKLTVKFE